MRTISRTLMVKGFSFACSYILAKTTTRVKQKSDIFENILISTKILVCKVFFELCRHISCYLSQINFPLPPVCPPPPFPLEREPTASAPRGDTLSTRIDCYRSLFMSLVRGRKESKLVRSLVLYVKLGVRFLAALRLVFRLLSCTYRV